MNQQPDKELDEILIKLADKSYNHGYHIAGKSNVSDNEPEAYLNPLEAEAKQRLNALIEKNELEAVTQLKWSADNYKRIDFLKDVKTLIAEYESQLVQLQDNQAKEEA